MKLDMGRWRGYEGEVEEGADFEGDCGDGRGETAEDAEGNG